jgi:chemotaxis protein MotB
MRRALPILLLAAAFATTGCKVKQLEAELAQVRGELDQTKSALDAEKTKNGQLTSENQSYQSKIAELETELAQLNSQIEDLAQKQGITAKELAELRAEKAKREKELDVYKGLFAQLKKLVDAGTIKVGFRKGRMVVELSNAILFDSGKSALRPEGVQAVAGIVPALKTVGKREFLVAGHTDNDPIKTARFKSNWELSTARAVSMVNAMTEAGYPANQLGAAGYGEFDPVVPNVSDAAKEQNRRIEIVLMPQLGDIPGMQEMLQGK